MPTKLSLTRKELDKTLKNYSIEKLINLFKKDFHKIFESSVGVWENYTLEQHTTFILTQFDRYFSNKKLPGKVSVKLFRVFLALHDLGKPKAVKEGNKGLQYEYTKELINEILGRLDFSNSEIKICLSLVDGDPIGQYLYTDNLKDAKKQTSERARRANVPINEFFELLLIYYKCDAGSYTKDAGGLKALDKLFIFDHKNKELKFSKETNDKIDLLKNAVLEK